MPISEQRRFSDEAQANFVTRFQSANGQVRSVPEALFISRARPNERSRVYLTPGFGFEMGALYDGDTSLPHQIIDASFKEGALSIVLPNKENSYLQLRGENDSFSFDVYYYPTEEELAALDILVLEEKGQERPAKATTGILPEILNRPNLDEILNARGASYDKESGIFQVRLGDLIVRAHAQVPINAILDKYFPLELRQNPLEAGVEHDVWARSDWMKDFGLTWTREVVTEVPIFEGNPQK